MEISDCCESTQVDANLSLYPIEPSAKVPQGFAAIPDSLPIHPTAPKPHLLWRIAVSALLIAFQWITWTIRLFNWVLQSIFGLSGRQKALYRELHQISQNGDGGQIRGFLITHSKETFAAGYIFSEFSDMPELYCHFAEILQGANICLNGDQGFFCRRWSEHSECYKRISSHNYRGDECYAIGHMLFWVDPDGNTRFQFENSPWKGFISSINHVIDFLRYRRDNEQQGVVGSSLHTEDFCIRVPMDPMDFLMRKVNPS